MTEPLKDKLKYYEDGRYGTDRVFLEEDVKLAVEYLKGEIRGFMINGKVLDTILSDKLNKKVNEAFEDVVK